MTKSIEYMEKDILEELDLSFNGLPSKYYPLKGINDIQYSFFLDLEHGYCETAGNRIHLYADSTKWAVVFEKSGYKNRGNEAIIELSYIGNCIKYITESYDSHNCLSNSKSVNLVSHTEYERIRNKEGTDMEQFELISDSVKSVKIQGQEINITYDPQSFTKMSVAREYDNPRNLMSFGGLIRYIHETNSSIIQSTESDIKTQLPPNISKIMTLDKFHYSSYYNKDIPPSKQELFQLIAKILVSKDSTLWKPIEKPNNHWSKWESGNL